MDFSFLKHFPVQHSHFSFTGGEVLIFSPVLLLLKLWGMRCMPFLTILNYDRELPVIEEMFYNSCCHWTVHLGNNHK